MDLRLADEWAQLETDGMEPREVRQIACAMRLGYARGYRDARKGLEFPGSEHEESA